MVCHCEIFFITWQLHFSRFLKHVFLTMHLTMYEHTIQLLCMFGPHFWITFLCDCITYWNNLTAMFRFRLLLRCNFITSQLRFLFVQMVSFFDDVRITLDYGNCKNVWIVYGSYILKWSYFSYIIFQAHQLLLVLIFLIILRLRSL